jgi:hypothetical protein
LIFKIVSKIRKKMFSLPGRVNIFWIQEARNAQMLLRNIKCIPAHQKLKLTKVVMRNPCDAEAN